MSIEWQIALLVIVTFLASAYTCVLVPLRQLFSKVDPKYFKRVKVKFPSFLFVGTGGRKSETGNVRNYGVTVPMFVLHIVGYLLTLATWIVIPVLDQFAGWDPDVLLAVPLSVALLQTVLTVTTEAVCMNVSRKRRAAEVQNESQTQQ